MEAVERRVHDLPARKHVGDRVVAQERNQNHEQRHENFLTKVRLGFRRRPLGPVDPASREKPPEERIIEGGHNGHDREPVEERKVPAEDQDHLEGDKQDPGNVPSPSRPKAEPWHHQLHHVIPERPELVEPARHEV